MSMLKIWGRISSINVRKVCFARKCWICHFNGSMQACNMVL